MEDWDCWDGGGDGGGEDGGVFGGSSEGLSPLEEEGGAEDSEDDDRFSSSGPSNRASSCSSTGRVRVSGPCGCFPLTHRGQHNNGDGLA